jgi:hypothetical protein
MGARRKTILACLLAALAAGTASAPPAAAVHTAKSCGTLAGYKLKARNVGCLFARRWGPTSYQRRGRPAGWSCTYGSSRSSIRMYCYRGSQAYFMQR